MKIVIAGANGFIGKYLRSYFAEHQLVLLSRHPKSNESFWDPAKGVLDCKLVANADVVINLAGESIAGRWSNAKLKRIAQSRYQATKLLIQALSCAPPQLYIGASAIGYYGADRGEECLYEESGTSDGVLSDVCRQWEALHIQLPSRVIIARLGVVLGQGGMLEKILPVFRLGLGAVLGEGKQWMSWIGLKDIGRMIAFCMEHQELSGAINFTAPHPVTNLQWSQILSRKLKRPLYFKVPRWMLDAVLGRSSELLVGSLKVYPDKLLKNGYQFVCPFLEQALDIALEKSLFKD